MNLNTISLAAVRTFRT